jgi:hypothetical protein
MTAEAAFLTRGRLRLLAILAFVNFVNFAERIPARRPEAPRAGRLTRPP